MAPSINHAPMDEPTPMNTWEAPAEFWVIRWLGGSVTAERRNTKCSFRRGGEVNGRCRRSYEKEWRMNMIRIHCMYVCV